MEPTMPMMDFPSGFAGFKRILSKELATQESFVDPMFCQDGQI
jgi:hypothetical protein